MKTNRNLKKKAGFTLVELMVVAVIVAILAAVAIPLMSANKKRAIATEAEAALGTMRSALRAMYAETGDYTVTPSSGVSLSAGDAATAVPGISVGDFDGRYFSDACYSIVAVTATNYTLKADGDLSAASQAAEVAGMEITLNANGDFVRTGL